MAEFSAALASKMRAHTIVPEDQSRALAMIGDLVTSEFECLCVTRHHFRVAATFCNRSTLGLRAGDALHLAIASGEAIKLCTRDRCQAEAGAGLGVQTEFVPSLP
jgi:hypothetical protein